MDNNKALVLFSGGQDSATCLVWALEKFDHVETVGFEYGQRHRVELEVRQQFMSKLRQSFPELGTRLGDDHMIDVSSIAELGETAMTADVDVKMLENGLPNTFVPGRNLLFLTYAAAIAYRRNIKHLVTGVCETDYSGYPDCRDDAIKALQATLNLGMESRYVIHTPLMWKTKSQTWSMAYNMKGDSLIELILKDTHTCYLGNRDTWHEWGFGCGDCPACHLRAKGFSQFLETQGP